MIGEVLVDQPDAVEDSDAVAVECVRRSAETSIDDAVEADIRHQLARLDLVDARECNARIVILKPVDGDEASVDASDFEAFGGRPFFPGPRLECQIASKRDPVMEWAPRAGQASGCGFDRRPGVAILELLRAEAAQRGM